MKPKPLMGEPPADMQRRGRPMCPPEKRGMGEHVGSPLQYTDLCFAAIRYTQNYKNIDLAYPELRSTSTNARNPQTADFPFAIDNRNSQIKDIKEKMTVNAVG